MLAHVASIYAAVSIYPASGAVGSARSQRGRHRGGRDSILPFALVARDRIVLLQRERDVVEPAEQAVADLVVDLERDLTAGEADLLLAQVDLRPDRRVRARCSPRRRARSAAARSWCSWSRRCPRRTARRSPGSRSPAGPTGRARARSRSRSSRRRRGSGWRGRSQSGLLGPVVEQELAEAGALDPLEELLGHDLVGVHVGTVEVADRPAMSRWVHDLSCIAMVIQCYEEDTDSPAVHTRAPRPHLSHGFTHSLTHGPHPAEHGRLGPLEVHFDLLEAGLAQPAQLLLDGVGPVVVVVEQLDARLLVAARCRRCSCSAASRWRAICSSNRPRSGPSMARSPCSRTCRRARAARGSRRTARRLRRGGRWWIARPETTAS